MSDTSKLVQLVIDFFNVLDIEEETDEGRLFKPNYISSCRVMDTEKLKKIIPEMKKIAFDLSEREVFGEEI